MTPIRRYSPVEWGALAVAAGVTAHGVTMIIAWVFELVGLLEFISPGPTLRFNTAVMFALCGLSLACSIFGHRKTAEGFALAAFLLSLLCTAKSLNVINLDVENFFFRPDESLNDRIGPGKVALGTSLSMLMFSLSILAQHRLRHGSLFALLLGIMICMISWVALNHYFMGADEKVGWYVTAGMAFTTACGLFLMGVAIIGLSCGPRRSAESTHWLSYSLAASFAVVSFMIWCELVDNETVHLRRETAAAATAVRMQVRERLQASLRAVDRFALRWGSLDPVEQHQDAKRLLEDFDGILSLYWIDDDLHVRWMCTADDRQDYIGHPLPPGPRHAAVKRARDTGRFTFTPVLTLLHGETGFIGYRPTVSRQGEMNGCAAAIFRLNMILDAIADDRRHTGFDFSVSDAENNQEVFSSSRGPTPDPAMVVASKLDLRGLHWHFNVWPTAQTVAGHYSYGPSLALSKGLFSALLIGITIQLRQRAVQRTAEAERSAAALRDSEQRFDLAVCASQDGIWEWRLGIDGFYASPRYREMLGYPLDDEPLSYQHWFTRVSAEDVPRIQQAIDDHFQRGAAYDVVIKFLTFRDDWVWLRIRGQGAWDANGQPVRMAGSITDITEEREAQRQLLEHVETIAESNERLADLAEAAEAAAAAKTIFLRNMSHELRTPLNSIIGFSTGLLRHVAAHDLDKHQRDRIERIAASGRHLLGLVNNVLDIAKAEAKEQSHQSEPIDLPELFEELVAMAEPLLQKRPAVKLDVHLADGLPVPILDRAKLKQILLNLLSNAAKFTDHGTITLSATYAADEWRFVVSDTGIGISADDQLRVFENFEQVHSPGRRVEGTGLGLSICAALANAMCGTITLTSRPGVGSAFTVIVPQADGPQGLNDDDAWTDSLASIDPRPLGALKRQRLLPPQR